MVSLISNLGSYKIINSMLMDKIRSSFIAHRGESFDAPENTLGAINLAWERGSTAVEIDIHLTADNEICVIHDFNTQRITGVKKIVRNSTMDELRALDAGLNKGLEWKNERIPTLSDVLKTVPEQGKLIIEIKSGSHILPWLQQDILESGLRSDQIEIIAFNYNSLVKAKKLMPEHKMLWLFIPKPLWLQFLLGRKPMTIIRKLKKHQINGVNIGNNKHFTSKLISEYKAANLLVYSWTIDDPKIAKKLLENGVDYITSNRPSWIVGELNEY